MVVCSDINECYIMIELEWNNLLDFILRANLKPLDEK